MSFSQQSRVLIAGASIAGLTLANIFQKIGIDFLVLEKHKDIAPDVGASIGIHPNGFRILDQVGCYEKIKALLDGPAFEHSRLYDEKGRVVHDIADATPHMKERLGYETIFVDRQMVIRVLYNNLRDKSKVLTGKGVVHVEEESGKVRVTTNDGSSFEGNVLVGADGIHSTARREMWRLAEQERPGYFPLTDYEPPTYYCCIFGISRPNQNFTKYSAQQVAGSGCSHLIATGPDHRIYWFLFKKLPKTMHGLYEKIPRYTEVEKDELAAAHAGDMVNEKLSFGDLYNSKTTSTLQALPEVVFSKWHYGRIITIGDAAHKFNPISGQGGNSAIEDGAVLANLLHGAITSTGSLGNLTTAGLNTVFENVHALRHDRTRTLMEAAHDMQSQQAKETFATRFIAQHVIPRLDSEFMIEATAIDVRPAARLDMLPVPRRAHVDLFYDERPARPIASSLPRFVAYGAFACVIASAFATMKLPLDHAPSTSSLADTMTSAPTASKRLQDLLNFIVLVFNEGVDWTDVGHTLQFLYLLLFLTPIVTIWYIEGSRYANRSSPISLPVIWGVVMNFTAIAYTAPLTFALRIWTTGGSHTMVGRYVPVAVAKAIAPAVLVGYVLPTLLMFVPLLPVEGKQHLILLWQFAVVGVSIIVQILPRSYARDVPVSNFDIYSTRDVPHLVAAYKLTFGFSLAYHVLSVSAVVLSGHPMLSFTRLLIPSYNHPEVDATSRQALMFTFLKWDFAFASVACLLYGIYGAYELRYKGLTTTKQACIAGLVFLGAQAVVGPGAALVGLWWWREIRLVGEPSALEDEGIPVTSKSWMVLGSK